MNQFAIGEAASLSLYNDGIFDCVIVSHFLYTVERNQLFQVVAECDRVLAEEGVLVLIQFLPQFPLCRPDQHEDGQTWWFQDYATAWTWSPGYCEVFRRVSKLEEYERSAIIVLKKSLATAYPSVGFHGAAQFVEVVG